ncbi:phage tail protein [Enterobacter cloacae]|nr:phage tail protein [Enterobacter cloacae]
MSAKFYTLLTDIGAAKLASAAALGVPLKITHMAVGSGGGVLPTPNAQQTALVAEERRAALNMLYIDPQNSSQIIAEQVIPENEGGWWIREVGLFDETGALIAVGNCPESYKPQLAEGSGRTQTVRMVLITSSTDNITLKIDPAVVLATRKYVDDKVLELKVYVDDLMAKHTAASDPHTQYAPKASPTFTGTPKAPTAAAGNNSTQLANTAFVQAAISALVASSPAALDTLNELAEALGNDPNFATTMTNALAGKQPLNQTLTELSGKDVAGLLSYLRIKETHLGILLGVKKITSSGTYNATPGTNMVIVELLGGGGAGGGSMASASGKQAFGGGGGAGAYLKTMLTEGFNNVFVTIGAGGAGVTGAEGGNGGDTKFGNNIVAGGGKGGSPMMTQGGGLSGGEGKGGVAYGANIIASTGHAGWSGMAFDVTYAVSGRGAESVLFPGGQASGTQTVNNGYDALEYGCGGGGACSRSTATAFKGGAGSQGIAIIWEYA